MKRLAFGLILGGTIYAPVELTRCIIRDMPFANQYYPKLFTGFIMELGFMWIGYTVAMVVLAAELGLFGRSRRAGLFHLFLLLRGKGST